MRTFDKEFGIPSEIHGVGTCEINGLFDDLHSLDGINERNGGHENYVRVKEVGDLEVWETREENGDYGVGLRSVVDCSLRDLEDANSVYTIVS